MPRPSPYPPLELDFDDLSPSGLRPAPLPALGLGPDAQSAPSDKRNTAPPEFDLEEFAKEVMGAADVDEPDLPEPPASDVRAVTDTARTCPPPAGIDSLYPEASDVRGTLNPILAELEQKLGAGDFRGALVVAEQLLGDDPANEQAKAAVARCHEAIEKLYVERLGSLERVPHVAVRRDEIPNLALDHRSGFILALVDGISTLDMILDMASMLLRRRFHDLVV